MSEEKKDSQEIEETTMEELEEMEEMKSEGFLSKAKNRLKKHRKKIVAGAALATVGLIGYMLGSKSKDGDEIDSEPTDVYELEDHSDSDETTEQ